MDIEEPVDAVDFDFGAKKKKKKKKDEQVAAPEVVEAAPVADASAADVAALEDALEDFSMDKKKKKKKKVDLDSGEMDQPVDAKPADADHSDIISLELHKKKRSKKDYATFLAELGDFETNEEFGGKKKKKKAVVIEEEAEGEDDDEDDGENDAADDTLEDDNDMDVAYDEDPMTALQGTDRDYTYQELLSRAFYKMRQANPDLGDKKRYTMIPPQVLREGTKKTIFGNLMDICKRMHRNQEHVMQFLFTELGTSGSLDGSHRLVIKGKYTPKHIENVLRHYISEYVTCKICKSPNTVLVKENRLNFVHCEACNSTRSVAAIKSGFSAQIGRRKH